MGLAGPKLKRKIAHDPNNTRWSRDTTTFGHRILRSQGWEPGQYLGAQDASQIALLSAASAAPIKVALKDDNLGLGAKIRQKQSDVCTGLDGFKDLLGRLNGKSEATIEKERQVRSELKSSRYLENKFGMIRFVSGGLLVGDQMKDLVSSKDEPEKKDDKEIQMKDIPAFDPSQDEKPKKEKKSKKRKAEEADTEAEEDSSRQRKKKRSKSEKSEAEASSESDDERKSSKKKKKAKKTDDEEPELSTGKTKKSKKDKKRNRDAVDESEEANTAGGDSSSVPKDDKAARRKEKKEKKDKKKKAKAEEAASSTEADSSSAPKAPSQDSGTSTPVGTGTSTPQPLSRHMVRSRNIASKRLAMADLQALNQIFMVKPV